VSKQATKLSLSPQRRKLLELMQDLHFGRIDGLAVRGGEPQFDPAPRVIRQIKFGGENGPRGERGVIDFALKAEVIELFGHFDRVRDGTVEALEIQRGLPFRMTVYEVVRA
jgi:hypothetical protein